MSEATRERIMEKKLGPQIVDRSSTIIENCWVPISGGKNKPTGSFDSVIKLIKSAEETVLVYSKYITHHEVVKALREASESGVRIYCLVGEIKHHQELDMVGTIRQREGIHSSFIITDHRGERPSGLFFVGELTSRELLEAPPVILDEGQARSMSCQFMYLFWNGASAERYGKLTVDAMPLVSPFPLQDAHLGGAFRTTEVTDITSVLGGGRLEELWLLKSNPPRVFYLASEADRIVVEVCETIKKKLSWKDLSGKKVLGKRRLPFFLAKTMNTVVIAGPDIGLVLNGAQASSVISTFLKPDWELAAASELSKLSGSVIRFQDNWDNQATSEVEDERKVDPIEPKVAQSMEDWEAGIPGPEISITDPMVKRWLFFSTLAPPKAPQDAVQDRLYARWRSFELEKSKVCAELSSAMEGLLDRSPKAKRVSYSNDAARLKEAVSMVEGTDLSAPTSTSEVEAVIAEIARIEMEWNKIVNELTSKESEEEPDEVEVMRKRPNKRPSTTKGLVDKLRETKPTTPLPRIGRLLEDGKGQKYLEIGFIDQIPESKPIAKQFHAKLVASKN